MSGAWFALYARFTVRLWNRASGRGGALLGPANLNCRYTFPQMILLVR
jgi:hypothetical protein